MNSESDEEVSEPAMRGSSQKKKSRRSRSNSSTKERPSVDNVELLKKDLSDEAIDVDDMIQPPPPPPIMYYCATQGCRSVEEFECLNKIEEGAYGVVYRAKDKKSSKKNNIKIQYTL